LNYSPKKIFESFVALIIWPFALIVFGISAGFYLLCTFFIPPKRLNVLARVVCHLILLGAGQIFVTKGKIPDPKNGPYLYLFNHQSYLDPFVLGATIREYISAVGGDFQFRWPVWGAIVKRYGVIPIIRENLTRAIHSLSLAEDEIRKGISLLISPEGTRTTTGRMYPFKKGPFHVSLNTGATIIPIGIKGAYNSYRRYDWRIYPGVITIKYGDPVKFEYYKNMTVEQLRDDIFNRIAFLCENDSIVTNSGNF
jgi:1-acyl-sn-glycerol-3-phosphate acyltransferase